MIDLRPPAGRPERRRATRPWVIAHVLSLALILVVLMWAGRGQYFFYDEWDFLAERAEWNLLVPHNGHLSFFPQLFTTLLKVVFGLHSYWPYLLLTFAAHLLVVHFLWRVMVRIGVQPMIALLVTLVFGVLAPGADNTLWAFQVGFITPIATGLAAFLVADREVVRTRDVVGIGVMLLIGAGFAGTALPMTVAVLIFLAVRHGWRTALAPAIAFVVVYGSWYLLFNRGPSGGAEMRAGSLYDLLVGVPEFIAHGYADSVALILPLAALSPILLTGLLLWVLLDMRSGGLRRIGMSHYLLLASLGFAALTALTRVGLGNEAASAGRYAYVYGALLAPAAALLLTRLVGRSRLVLGVVCALLAVLSAYNAGGLLAAGRSQADLERSVLRAMSAAVSLDDGSAELGERYPSAIVAPTLSMNDIRRFEERGEFTPGPFTPDDELDVRVNLFLRADSVDRPAPRADECALPDSGNAIAVDPETQFVFAPAGGNVRVHASEGSAFTEFAQIALMPGTNRLSGLDDDILLRLNAADAGGLCVIDVG
jgi:hypothetical protein